MTFENAWRTFQGPLLLSLAWGISSSRLTAVTGMDAEFQGRVACDHLGSLDHLEVVSAQFTRQKPQLPLRLLSLSMVLPLLPLFCITATAAAITTAAKPATTSATATASATAAATASAFACPYAAAFFRCCKLPCMAWLRGPSTSSQGLP